MAQRLQLQALLTEVLGSSNVYFQPPPNVALKYPCIVYSRDDLDISHADNDVYRSLTRYQVTVIDRDPDSAIPEKVAQIPMCRYNRFYIADSLNHDVFNLYF